MTALGELLDALRADGFPIGVDDHVRVARLIALEGVAWTDEAELRVAVRALIAKDVRERAAFDAAWARVFAVKAVDARWAEAEGGPPRRGRTPAARRALVPLAVAAVAVIAVAVYVGTRPPHIVLPPVPELPDIPGSETPRIDSPRIDAPRIDDLGSATAPRALPPPPRDDVPATHDALDLGLAGLGGLAIALAGGAALLVRRRRARFVPGPYRYTPKIPAATRPVLATREIEDGAANLTWQTEAPGAELDIRRTIDATAARAGMPAIVYRPPPAAPRYLVLEEANRPWSFVYDELLRGLAREGVALDRYTFTGDPTWCTSLDGRERRPLRDLVEHCDAILAIGDAAVDPTTPGEPEWVRTLRHVPRRLWIVPSPRRSEGEAVLARDMLVGHGVATPLAALRPGADTRDPVAPPYPAVIDTAPASSLGFDALYTYLGDPAMRVLAALAVAGAPSVSGARWLSEQVLPLSADTWLRLVALPWLSSGTWPASLRARLVAWLRASAPSDADRADRAASEVLSASEPPPGSAAHLRWQLEVALRSANPRAAARPLLQTALHREVELHTGPSRRFAPVVAALGTLCLVGGLSWFALEHLPSHTPTPPDAAELIVAPPPPDTQVPDTRELVAIIDIDAGKPASYDAPTDAPVDAAPHLETPPPVTDETRFRQAIALLDQAANKASVGQCQPASTTVAAADKLVRGMSADVVRRLSETASQDIETYLARTHEQVLDCAMHALLVAHREELQPCLKARAMLELSAMVDTDGTMSSMVITGGDADCLEKVITRYLVTPAPPARAHGLGRLALDPSQSAYVELGPLDGTVPKLDADDLSAMRSTVSVILSIAFPWSGPAPATGFWIDGGPSEVTTATADDGAKRLKCSVRFQVYKLPDKSIIGTASGSASVANVSDPKALEKCLDAVAEDVVRKQVIPLITRSTAPATK